MLLNVLFTVEEYENALTTGSPRVATTFVDPGFFKCGSNKCKSKDKSADECYESVGRKVKQG